MNWNLTGLSEIKNSKKDSYMNWCRDVFASYITFQRLQLQFYKSKKNQYIQLIGGAYSNPMHEGKTRHML